jgi:geranylgeranyl diphosphate synthase, type I
MPGREGTQVSGVDGRSGVNGSVFSPLCTSFHGYLDTSLPRCRGGLADIVRATVADFVAEQCRALSGSNLGIAVDVLMPFLDGGKCLRSTFVYLGWMCGADADDAAVRAAASFEILHAFALLQDDVMDAAPIRRGRPSTHMQFARWHRERALPGSAQRFGESAAVLLGDLCLVWSEQMLRDSGLDDTALSRAWPRYDAMRTELVVGQFADLVNDAGALPTLNEVLGVSRRKSGNYTVRRPLEIGAALAGCGEAVLRSLSDYGEAVGEAFQLRDDLLGVYGSPAITGKPIGGDLRDGNATSVVVAAYHLARGSVRRDLAELMSLRELAETDIAQWQRLIIASGALALVEQMIDERLARALSVIADARLSDPVGAALAYMAGACAERAA